MNGALTRLEAWIEREEHRGWDPYDHLNSRLLRRLTFGSRWLGVTWVQLGKRSPINFRPLLGVPKAYNPKGMGLFLASYLRRHWQERRPEDQERARFFADWLRAHTTPGYAGACWGYHFPWPNREFFAPAGTPNIVTTAFNALALLEAGDLRTARSACDFVLGSLHVLRPSADTLSFSYTPLDRSHVHNASLLGAELLAAVAAASGEAELLTPATAAARLVAREQREDGSWVYGFGRRQGWVDSFHTGYVLCSLRRIGAAAATDEFEPAVERGYRFWRERMFLADGTPRYYADRVWPIDAHTVAQAVLTSLEFADRDPDAVGHARRVAAWGIEHMQDPAGFFHYQIHPRYRIRIPYMRWTQAWMQRALRELLWVEAGRPRLDNEEAAASGATAAATSQETGA